MKTFFTSLMFVLLASIQLYAKDMGNQAEFASKKAPLSFLENKGQITDQNRKQRNDIDFQLKAANGLSIYIGDGAIHYQFSKADKMLEPMKPEDRFNPEKMKKQQEPVNFSMYRMDVALIGANKQAQLITEEKQSYYENYFNGNSNDKGNKVESYGKITYKDIYPNIDWVLYTKNNELKHEFIVHQGGNPKDIKLQYGGATNLGLNKDGSLTAATPQGTITEQAPVCYALETHQPINSSFQQKENTISYNIDSYEGTLIIDPSLAWATYFGGSGWEEGYGVATDGSGHIYISGFTSSPDIATIGTYTNSVVSGGVSFLAKMNPTSGSIIWVTYFGGNSNYGSGGYAEVVTDQNNHVYLSGNTYSTATGKVSLLITPGLWNI
jgi:hypothetical protein